MMTRPYLDSCLCNLPWSASGFPTPRVDCCRLTPSRPNSLIQGSGFVACNVRVGVDFLPSGQHQSLTGTIATVGLGINSP